MVNDAERAAALKPLIVAAVSKVFDPEIPVNVFELGLIYDIIVTRESAVGIRMTLTAPACPAAQVLSRRRQENAPRKCPASPKPMQGGHHLARDPPWDRDRMSDAAKLQLGMF